VKPANIDFDHHKSAAAHCIICMIWKPEQC